MTPQRNPARRPTRLALAAALALTAVPALATNGMNMEGYGPISTGMGGASQAFDHGTAAMAQNPATLGLMGGPARLDLALGQLGPRVASTMAGMPRSASDGTSYVMPALGYARRSGALTWGLGLFAQGGMGTEYGRDSFLAAGSGEPVRSELGVGRVLLPLVWQASPDLAIGGTLDFVWANLDLRMAAAGAQLGAMAMASGIPPTGNLAAALPALGSAPWARVDFSNRSDFSGAAKSTGWAAKLGAVWKATPAVTLGASYQTETDLGDMETTTRGASLSAAGGFTDPGKIIVRDFQWPSTLAIGVAWQASPSVLVAADVKRIGWSDVMESFRMRFVSAGMGGTVDFALPQDWKDQTVTSIGVAWAATPQLTLRAGVNVADNPVPDATVNPLFPATVKEHYTLGLGYALPCDCALNASLTVAPSVRVTSGQGVVITHRQTNLQVMFTKSF